MSVEEANTIVEENEIDILATHNPQIAKIIKVKSQLYYLAILIL